MKCSCFYGIMAVAKNPPRVGACGSFEVELMICDLRSDHNLDHLRLRTTWELWTLRHGKARFSDEKARKSTQNEAKNRCFCVWDVDAAGSNPVTPTKIGFGEQFPKPFSLFSATQLLRADRFSDSPCSLSSRQIGICLSKLL